MSICFSCPECRSRLALVQMPIALACPFCRVGLHFANHEVPVGRRVRCAKCHGVFTADAPPPLRRVIATEAGACPLCGMELQLPRAMPPGKRLRCPGCAGIFRTGPAAPVARPTPTAAPTPAIDPTPSAGRSGRKTFLAGIKASSKSRTQLAPPVQMPTPPATDDDPDVLADMPTAPPSAPPSAPPRPPISPPAPLDGPDVLADAPRVSAAAVGPVAADSNPLPETQRMAVAAPPVREPAPAAKAKAAALRPVPAPPAAVGRDRAAKRRPAPVSPAPAPAPAPASAPAEADEEEDDANETAADVPAARTTVAPPRRSPAAPHPAVPRPAARPEAAPRQRRDVPWSKLLLALAVAGVVAGLGAGGYYLVGSLLGSRPTVYAVQGVVLFRGKPAAGARVTLHPQVRGRQPFFPTGKVGDDGSFKLTTFDKDDGAPAGRYNVTIVRGPMEMDEYAELSKKLNPQELTRMAQQRAKDPLYEKYIDPRSSGLAAEIRAEPGNKLEFSLK